MQWSARIGVVYLFHQILPHSETRDACFCMIGKLLKIWQPYAGIFSSFMSVSLLFFGTGGGGGVMKDPASLHMCLFCAIVFEVNPSIVWFLTVLELPKTESFVG